MDSPALASIENQVARLSRDEQIALAAWVNELVKQDKTNSSKREVEWVKIRGLLTEGPDPLEYQRTIRSDWDRDPA
jgi:hypothetical protein